MMTPVSPVYGALVIYIASLFIGMFLIEFCKELKRNNFNFIKTLVEFLNDF